MDVPQDESMLLPTCLILTHFSPTHISSMTAMFFGAHLPPLPPFLACLNLGFSLTNHRLSLSLPFTRSLSFNHCLPVSPTSPTALPWTTIAFLQASFTRENEGSSRSPVPQTSSAPHLSLSRPVSRSRLTDTKTKHSIPFCISARFSPSP